MMKQLLEPNDEALRKALLAHDDETLLALDAEKLQVPNDETLLEPDDEALLTPDVHRDDERHSIGIT